MSRLGRENERGLREVERCLGLPVFTWSKQDYPCSPGKSDEVKVFGDGGFAPAFTCVLNVRLSVFPAEVGQPKAKDPIKYKGHDYIVDRVESSADGAWAKLLCVDPLRKA